MSKVKTKIVCRSCDNKAVVVKVNHNVPYIRSGKIKFNDVYSCKCEYCGYAGPKISVVKKFSLLPTIDEFACVDAECFFIKDQNGPRR